MPCVLSITDIGKTPKAPTKYVYDQIMDLLQKAIQAHTELPTGGKKGQVLKKQSDDDYDTAWEDDKAGSVVDLSNYYNKGEIDAKLKVVDDTLTRNQENIDNNIIDIHDLRVRTSELEAEVLGVNEILESVAEGGAF
jgi:hypothetical protein